MKLPIVAACITISLAFLVNSTSAHAEEGSKGFSQKIDESLKQKRSSLLRILKDPLFLKTIESANENNLKLSAEEINTADQIWISGDKETPFIKNFLENECSKKLKNFQQNNPSFDEIFVTDKKGLVVCLTNKTSDYLQSDETWWQKTYNKGVGRSHRGPVEFDESAGSQVIAIYLALTDPKTGEVEAVAKALVNLLVLRAEI